jgi:hypothetical protein
MRSLRRQEVGELVGDERLGFALEVFTEAAEAGGEGGFDPPGGAITRVLVALDDRGSQELSDALARLLEDAQAV